MKVNHLAPNQTAVYLNGESFFQSYETIIAKTNQEGNIILDERHWNFSKTTSKYLAQYLGNSSAKETRKQIKQGMYKFADLNNGKKAYK